jgi:hypothetical protein
MHSNWPEWMHAVTKLILLAYAVSIPGGHHGLNTARASSFVPAGIAEIPSDLDQRAHSKRHLLPTCGENE